MDKFDVSALSGRQLKLFLEIFDSGSVSRAAERFGLNQSTASHHLDRMREALEDPLFLRVGKSITPTDFARTLVPRVRAVVSGIEGLTRRESFDPRLETHPFTIATNTAELIPELIALRDAVARTAPDVPVRLLELGSRSRVRDLLTSGEVELVITIRARPYDPAVATWELRVDEQACFYDPTIRGPIETLEDYGTARHAVLDFGGTGTSTVGRALAEHGLVREVVFGAPDVNVLAAAIRGTDMITTMHSGLQESAFGQLASCPPPIEIPPMVLDMVWHRRDSRSGRSLWLRRHVADVFGARPPNGDDANSQGIVGR